MADDSNPQDRNLPASARKLKKARASGQVARSRDLGHFVALAAGGGLLLLTAPVATAWIREALVQGLRFDRVTLADTGAMGAQLQALAIRMCMIVLPFGFAMLAAGVASTLAIGGWNWTWQPLAPDFGKLDPVKGLAGIVSRAKLVDALKGSLLALVLGAIGAWYLQRHVDAFGAAMAMELPAAVEAVAGAMLGGLGLLLVALAVFAAIDVPWQRHRHGQTLKMSHQERKQEFKELEGNQEVKSRVRARMREMTKRRMLAAVPKADLVVMNPTHYAVALKYDEKKMAAPRVVAKGADLVAMTIRDLAKTSKVPVLQAPVLARALYAHAELDREIPAALFAAVAQVLAYVYQLRAAMAGQVAMPGELPEVNVPAELDPHAHDRRTGGASAASAGDADR